MAKMVVNKRRLSVAKDNGKTDNFTYQRVGEIVRPRSWALYGRSGSGKTTLAASFPKPILILDIRDQGTDSVADVKDVFVKEITDWEQIEETYYWLKEHPAKFKTIVFDTVTQMQQLCMEHIVFKKNKSEVGDWGSMTRRQWGEVAGEMKDQVVNFRDLPFEVVFIAQERASVGEEDDNPDNMITPEVGPAVSPSIARVLNASVSIIGCTFIRQHFYTKLIKGKRVEKEEPQYCLRIGPNPVYTTKIRKPKGIIAPSFIENPEYKDIIDLIKGA